MRFLNLMLFLSILDVQAQQKPKDAIVISTTYCNGEHLFFSYQNYYNDHIISLQINPVGIWRIIPSNEPLLLVFSREMKLYPVYALPGDTISARCNETYGVEFDGNRSFTSLNALAIVENDVGFLIPSLSGIQISEKLDFQYIVNSFDSLNIARIKRLQSLSTQNDQKLNSSFSKIMSYRLLDDYLRPFVQKFEDFSPNQVPLNYVEKCNTFMSLANADSLIHYQNYRSFITNYNKFLSRDSIFNKGEYQTLYHTANYFFKGRSKDFLLFQLIKNGLIGESSFVDNFRNSCENNLYLDYIDSLIEKNNGLNTNIQLLQDTLSKVDGSSIYFDDFLKARHGKPIYIDFWASWCKPCIKEFGPLQEFEKRYEKRIDFVSISIDEDRGKWLKAIEKYSLKPKNQWLIAKNAPLAKYLDIQGIPRFVMIDRHGQVFSLDAPRPSNSNELTHMLENTLKQQ